MNFPRQKYYTVDELAECWGVKSSQIEHFIEERYLILTAVYYDLDGDEKWVDLPLSWQEKIEEETNPDPNFSRSNKRIIKLEEVERFEREHSLAMEDKPEKTDVVGNKERGTWLKIIYLLAAKLADTNKSAYIKKDDSFNFSKFEEVLKGIASDLQVNEGSTGGSGHGLSNDNLKKILDEAKKLFPQFK